MVDLEREAEARAAAFAFLDEAVRAHPDAIPARVLQTGFTWRGERIALLGSGPGIWKPRALDAALSVMTTAPKPGQPPPYLDDWHDESHLSYAYQGTQPDFWQNRALRTAFEHQLPLVYLLGVERGGYLAEYPAYIERDRPADLRVDIVFRGAPGVAAVGVEVDGRSYAHRVTRTRLHQAGFRIRVLRAYEERCAICSLRRSPLLDAAHIVPDGEPEGLAVTANGLSLCKLHHAAYDQMLIGVRPDHVVEVAQEVLDDTDGPMLVHGLQVLHGQRLRQLPTRAVDKPTRERLEWRYERFRGHSR